jgi:hypothetical protein
MPVVPSSPRVRRRLVRLGIALIAAAAAAAIAVALRSPKQPSSAPAKSAPPAQLVTRSTRVTPTERRAINATLDRFLGAALDRSSPATAWRLAGPELKAGSTLSQWRAGTSPIPYFPPREKTFRGWTTVDAGPRYVVFDHLVVHPRHGSKTSSWIFTGEVVKRGSHWLVNRLYTIAVMKKPTKAGTHQLGPQDFAAPGASASGAPREQTGGALGTQWLIIAGVLAGLVFVFPLGFVVASGVRARRRRRQYEQTRDRTLPPLPSSIHAASEAAGGGAARGRRH